MRKIIFLLLISTNIYAADPVGLGLVAENIMGPMQIFSDFIYSACLVLGISFLFACIVKYREHKRSPLMVPISTVVFLLIMGVILVCLPFLGSYLQNGIPYTFLR